MASASPSASPAERFASHLASAQEAKTQGNAALQREQPRPASFQYKRACLYLLEYLPEANAEGERIVPLGDSTSGSSSSDYAGVVQLLSGNKNKGSTGEQGSTGSTSRFDRLTVEQQRAVLELYAQLQNNLALAHYKLGRHREGMACAAQALRTAAMLHAASCGEEYSDAARTKALLRRARCAVAMKDWAVAEEDLRTLRAEAEGRHGVVDAAVPALEKEMHAARTAEATKEKALMKKMFAAA